MKYPNKFRDAKEPQSGHLYRHDLGLNSPCASFAKRIEVYLQERRIARPL
jgi:hypothetical protein